jgi:hypothetical protein
MPPSPEGGFRLDHTGQPGSGRKKFMGDGAASVTQDDARPAMETYKKDGVQVHLFLEEDKYLVYTRKLVTQESAAI